MADITDQNIIGLEELLSKENVEDSDILIIQDSENTKQVEFRDLRSSMISDTENPAANRIYSSLKVDETFTALSKQITDDVGIVEKNVQDLQDNSVSTVQLNTAIQGLDDKKTDKTTTQLISDELGNKRSTAIPLTGLDIECPSESEKLHMAHLGTDILNALTGSAAVTVPSVPSGGWVSEDLADGLITGAKLSSAYNYKQSITSGDMNVLINAGLYLVSENVTGIPKYEVDETDPKMIEVIRYGDNGKYIRQRAYYIDTPTIDEKRPFYFERTGLVSDIHTLEFVGHFEITEINKLEQDMLGATYNNRGNIDSGSVYDLTDNGNYLCNIGVTNLPTADKKYMVNVCSYGTYVEYSAKTLETSGTNSYMSFVYLDSANMPVIVNWFSVNSTSKSKFHNKKVHIFGDGISYGLGASDIPNTSYPAILASKYGYTILNHALSDATYGTYGDDSLTDKSVMMQAQLATQIDTGDYAIIFAGSNDYKCGLAQIGTDYVSNVTTFKGAINTVINTLLTASPKLNILLVTPIYRGSTVPGDNIDSDSNMVNDKRLEDFSSAIVDIGKRHHIPVLNLLDESMINSYTKSIYLNTNGIYPTDAGHELLCEKIHSGMCRYY